MLISACGDSANCGSGLLTDLTTSRRGVRLSEQDVTGTVLKHLPLGSSSADARTSLSSSGFQLNDVGENYPKDPSLDHQYFATANSDSCSAIQKGDRFEILIGENNGKIETLSAVVRAEKTF